MAWSKRDVRNEARRFAATQLESQDLPDWAIDAGIPQELLPVFEDEMNKIAARISATIKERNEHR